MAESHVISALTSKRAELLGKVTHYKQQIKRINNDLAHTNSAIKIFYPDFNLKIVKPKKHITPNKFFRRGERAKLVLDVLREKNKPLTTHEISDRIKELKNIEADIISTIRDSLVRYHKNGVVQKSPSSNGTYYWQLNS